MDQSPVRVGQKRVLESPARRSRSWRPHARPTRLSRGSRRDRRRSRDCDDSRRPCRHRRGRSHDRRDRGESRRRSRRSRSRSRLKSRSRSRSRSSSSDIDDSVGHLHAQPGDRLDNRYVVREELGTGTFGKVFRCLDTKHNDEVAVKVVRKIERYVDSAKIEASILSKIFDKQRAAGVSCCMKLYSSFASQGHYFMVCQPLGKSLYDVIKANQYVGLPIAYVKHVSKQLFEALSFLKSISLIHTDLKLENVLFTATESIETQVMHRGSLKTIRIPKASDIKLIDFGGATFDDDPKKTVIINTRQYRGPEVILELGWSYPSDIWSAACIVAEIYTGDLLFPAHDDLEHLCRMEFFQGQFPSWMPRESPVANQFFNSRDELQRDRLSRSLAKDIQEMKPFSQLISFNPSDTHSGLVELLEATTRLSPRERWTAEEALDSRFLRS